MMARCDIRALFRFWPYIRTTDTASARVHRHSLRASTLLRHDGRRAPASMLGRGRQRHHSGRGLPGTGIRDRVGAIITNPPYALAREFIERALHFDDTRIVAMLLRTDFDHAASRAHLFADCALDHTCAMFAKKVVLTKR